MEMQWNVGVVMMHLEKAAKRGAQTMWAQQPVHPAASAKQIMHSGSIHVRLCFSLLFCWRCEAQRAEAPSEAHTCAGRSGA